MNDLMSYVGTLATGATLRLAVGLLVLGLFWLAAGLVRLLIRRLEQRADVRHRQVVGLLAQTAQIGVLAFGIVTALGTIGINVSALVAGLGLTGFALGFALRDAISNLLAGILILLYQPFQLDDEISVAGLEGKVLEIDPRYTTLQQQNKRLLIPNAMLFTNTVTVVKNPDPPS